MLDDMLALSEELLCFGRGIGERSCWVAWPGCVKLLKLK